MKDNRIVKYNVDFIYRDYKYKCGCVSIDLSNINNMKGFVTAGWSKDYATSHMLKVLSEATGIGGGWSFPLISIIPNDFGDDLITYKFHISSRLYANLRKIYERKLMV